MSKAASRTLVVIRKQLITPHMLRITLGGDEVSTIPEDQESGYVKLIFPTYDGKRLMRTYTIRHQRDHEIDIDFMLHDDGGPASTWAVESQPNDTILVGGPGPKKMISDTADWQLFVGDMTALPAISVNLSQLPSHAKGYAVIEVVSKDDIQELDHPAGITINWVINDTPGQDADALLREVQSLDWLDGEASVWAACEFSSMKALRNFFKNDKAISKENLYISSYWKLGSNEDQHKVIKRDDAEATA